MMTTPMRPMAMLAASGATLVALVVAGLAALDWEAASLEDSTPRVAAFVASICLAGLLWLLAAAPLVRVPAVAGAVHGPAAVLAVLDVARQRPDPCRCHPKPYGAFDDRDRDQGPAPLLRGR